MENSDFYYKQKPAFISFLLIYFFCFGISLWLIDSSPAISKEISRQFIAKLGIPRSNPLWDLPYGIIFSLPLLIYGIRTLLWNLMSSYELNSSEIRLLIGHLIRNERFFLISSFNEISFKQNLIEAPFHVGSLVLKAKGRSQLIIKGVYNVRYVVECLRKKVDTSYKYSNSTHPLPGIILLDLKLPKVDGIEILRNVKADRRLKLIPVVVLTSSKEDRDVIESYDLGVNSYIRKPVDFDQFVETVKHIGFYWLLMNEYVTDLRR